MRMRVAFPLLALAALASLAGCGADPRPAAPPLPAVALPAELDRVLRDYEAAYARRDAAALGALFAEDGFVLQPGRPPVRGRPAIAAALEGEGGALSLVPIAFGVDDSVGYVVGTFGAERSAGEGGKFVLALARGSDGVWRIAADMANPNRP